MRSPSWRWQQRSGCKQNHSAISLHRFYNFSPVYLLFWEFYCCFCSFFFLPLLLGLLDMHGPWWLDERFGSSFVHWHWSHVPPRKCPLSGWALLPGSLNPSQHISQFLPLLPLHLSFFLLFATRCLLFAHSLHSAAYFLFGLLKCRRCCTIVWLVLQHNLNGTETPASSQSFSPSMYSLSLSHCALKM